MVNTRRATFAAIDHVFALDVADLAQPLTKRLRLLALRLDQHVQYADAPRRSLLLRAGSAHQPERSE